MVDKAWLINYQTSPFCYFQGKKHSMVVPRVIQNFGCLAYFVEFSFDGSGAFRRKKKFVSRTTQHRHNGQKHGNNPQSALSSVRQGSAKKHIIMVKPSISLRAEVLVVVKPDNDLKKHR